MGATKKTLDIYRTEGEQEWRWTLTQAGRIIGASSQGYKRKDGVEGNVLSALGINLADAEWERDDRIVKQGTVERPLSDNPTVKPEIIHVTLWKRP